MCGTPFPADALGGVVPAQVRYGFEDRYLSKSNALDEGPGEEREREHRVSAFGVWRPLDRVALLARLPYAVKEIRQTPLGEATETRTSRGLGDGEVMALIGLVRPSAPGLRWQSGLGVGVEAFVQVPVLQSLDGIQRERATARVSLSFDR